MRIVYTVLNGHVAGGQLVCLQMMEAAREAGHQVSLVTPYRGEFTELLEQRDISVVLLPMSRTFHIHRAWQFRNFVRKWRADLVHCHDAVPGMILSCLGSYLAGVPFIGHVHIENTFSRLRWVRTFQLRFYNFVLRWADAIVAISESTRQSLIKQGLPRPKVTVIPNGVETAGYANGSSSKRARKTLGLNGSEAVVGCVARLCPVKGQRELILAAAKVCEVMPTVKFVFIGEDLEFGGAYRKQLQDLSAALGLSGLVVFTGYQADAVALMAGFDVFVLPSHAEGLPLTILEAMAAERPVIATPVGGVPELVIDGTTGVLVPPGDCEALADAMITLLADKEKARTMGLAGRQRVEKEFALRDVTARILAVYAEVASRRMRGLQTHG